VGAWRDDSYKPGRGYSMGCTRLGHMGLRRWVFTGWAGAQIWNAWTGDTTGTPATRGRNSDVALSLVLNRCTASDGPAASRCWARRTLVFWAGVPVRLPPSVTGQSRGNQVQHTRCCACARSYSQQSSTWGSSQHRNMRESRERAAHFGTDKAGTAALLRLTL
jgi:hypothetical protein